MIWYIENYVRSRAERVALDDLAAGSEWLIPLGWHIDKSLKLFWEADVVTATRYYPIRLEYPAHFPYSPPIVAPRDATQRWSSHQYRSGELCLEVGPDNWQPHFTGAQMIESAYRLLLAEETSDGTGAEIVSRHRLSLGQETRGEYRRLLLTPQLTEVVRGLEMNTAAGVEFLGLYSRSAMVYLPVSVKDSGDIPLVAPALPRPLLEEGIRYSGAILRLGSKDVALDVSTVASVQERLQVCGINAPDCKIVVVSQEGAIQAFRLDDDGSVDNVVTIETEAARPRAASRYDDLKSKEIAIVGCGSLGSKVAVSLARSGVGRFLLVDDDLLLPENLARHDLDWRDVGMHKASSLARRLELVSPKVRCKIRAHRLGGQEASGSLETLIESLAKSDIIVDVTANSRAFGYLVAASALGKVPLLWAEIFGGGFGGLIARHRPGREPEPHAIRSAIENWCQEQGLEYRVADGYDEVTQREPLLALDADVGVIAAHATRLAIDTLLGSQPSQFPYSVYLIGLSQE